MCSEAVRREPQIWVFTAQASEKTAACQLAAGEQPLKGFGKQAPGSTSGWRREPPVEVRAVTRGISYSREPRGEQGQKAEHQGG